MYAENWSKRDGKLRTPRGCKNPVNKRPGGLIDRLVYLNSPPPLIRILAYLE